MNVSTGGTREALRRLLREIRGNAVHLSGVFAARRLRGRRDLRLHLGCGGRALPGWLNVDLWSKADLRLDLREPIPLDDGCASTIFAEHFLEHLEYPGEAERFLGECHRLLVPTGTLRLGVPDTRWPLLSYAEGPNAEYFQLAARHWHPTWIRTALEHVNYHFRERYDEHRWAYDAETLLALLARLGFQEARETGFEPATDSERRRLGTLYVEARR